MTSREILDAYPDLAAADIAAALEYAARLAEAREFPIEHADR